MTLGARSRVAVLALRAGVAESVEAVEHLLPNYPAQNRCAPASRIEPRSAHLYALTQLIGTAHDS